MSQNNTTIPQHIIDKVSEINIVDVVSEYVTLKKAGVTYGFYKLRETDSGREICYMFFDDNEGDFKMISDFVFVPIVSRIGYPDNMGQKAHSLLLHHVIKNYDKTVKWNIGQFGELERSLSFLVLEGPYNFSGTASQWRAIWDCLSYEFANMNINPSNSKVTMETPKFKSGDKVMIVTNPDHADHVKKHYGEVLEIDSLLDMGNYTLYKVKGIRDYACEDDLAFILPGENLSLWKTAKKVIEDFALNNHYDSACPPEESLEKEIDGISDIWYYTAECASECIPYWYVQRLMRAGSAEIVCRVYKESDARLIAIAPELYKTCHELCAHLDYLLRTYSMFIDSYRFAQIKNELKESYLACATHRPLTEERRREMSKQQQQQEQQPVIINGITLTPQLAAVLQDWQEYDGLKKSMPRIYIEKLTSIQDFLCMMLNYFCGPGQEEQIKTIQGCLRGLIYIKDDLRKFVPEGDK